MPQFFMRLGESQPRSTITVTDQITHTMAEGLGVNWFSTFNAKTYPAPEDDARWQRILDHATFLNINFVRFGQDSHFLMDERGNFTPGHWSFDQLRHLNAWAEPRGVNIIADSWWLPEPFQFKPWPGAPRAWGGDNSEYQLGIEDVDGYINRFVIPYLKYLSEDMGCTAVRWYNHVNEPLLSSFQGTTPEGIDECVRYVEVLAAIRQGLDEAGLAHIGSMGPDSCSHLDDWCALPRMLEVGADPDPYIQGYCIHQYQSRFDWDTPHDVTGTDPMSVTINDQVAKYSEYAHAHGKPYLITELGMFQYGWRWGDPAGPARHDSALMEAEFAVRAMDKGADCLLRWAWLNPGDLDGWWQLLNTADGSDSPVTNSYYSYATLMRYVGRQAKILATDVAYVGEGPSTVHSVAVENQDGSRSLLIVNDNYHACEAVTINFPVGAGTTIRKIVNDPVRKHQEVEEFAVNEGHFEHADVLSPMSLTVYTTASNR